MPRRTFAEDKVIAWNASRKEMRDSTRAHIHAAEPHLWPQAFIKKIGPVTYRIERGFVPDMRVPGIFYVNKTLEPVRGSRGHTATVYTEIVHTY